jgi:hypothetical protein
VRLDPALMREVRELTPNLSRTVGELLTAWVQSERRKRDKVAKHLTPPTARELAARRKGGAA